MASNPQCCRRAPLHRVAATLVFMLAGGLTACSSLGDNLPAPIGLPQGVPERPAVQPEFLAVHDMPPARDTKPLTEAERKQLEADLKEVRDRQEQASAKSNKTGKPSSKPRAEKASAESRSSTKPAD